MLLFSSRQAMTTVVLGILAVLLLGGADARAGLFDTLEKGISEAGRAISETGGSLLEEAENVGKDLGLVEEPEPARQKSNGVAQQPSRQPAPVFSETKELPAAAGKLPGGVSSRIGKMNKELDKVEMKMAKGAGGPVDRAQRAKHDLQRAQRYMAEIDRQYGNQVPPDHPELVAAKNRLAEVERSHAEALQSAIADQQAAADAADEAKRVAAQQAGQAAEQERLEEERQRAARAESMASCEEWSRRLAQYTYGDKHFNSYPTEDEALLATWKANHDEAAQAVAQYPPETCPQADSEALVIRRKMEQFEAIYGAAMAKKKERESDMGRFVFADRPLSYGRYDGARSHFAAGERIYGIIEVVKPWSEIYKQTSGFTVRVDVKIDGEKIHAQFVTIKSAEYAARNHLSFDIAPDPGQTAAYTDDNIEYGKSTPTVVQGPNELTSHLAALAPGEHTMDFSLNYYGKTWAAGSLTVSGADYTGYASLHRAIADGVAGARVMPAARMINKKYEQEMIGLLKDAGWSNVYRLNIIDKDWWIERVDGGNTPVKSRYLAAAAMTSNEDGSYHYRKCTFHQDKLITGGFGAFYLSHQGDAVPIDSANIDK